MGNKIIKGLTEHEITEAHEVLKKAHGYTLYFERLTRDLLQMVGEWEQLRKLGRNYGLGLDWAGFLKQLERSDRRLYLLLAEALIEEWDIKPGRKYGICKIKASTLESSLLLLGRAQIEEELFNYTGKLFRFQIDIGGRD